MKHISHCCIQNCRTRKLYLKKTFSYGTSFGGNATVSSLKEQMRKHMNHPDIRGVNFYAEALADLFTEK